MELKAEEKLVGKPNEAAYRQGLRPVLAPASARADATTLRVAALSVLLVSVALDRFTVPVSGLNVKSEHAAIVALLAAFVVTSVRHISDGLPAVEWRRLLAWPLFWIAPYIGVILASSLINSPDPGTSVRHTAMIALVASGAWMVYWLVNTPTLVRLAMKIMIALGVLEAAYVFVILAASRFGSTLGTQPGNGWLIVPYGTLWEPNLLGSFLAASSILLVAALFSADKRLQVGIAAGLALLLSALGLSLARASWLAFIAGSTVVLLLYFWATRNGNTIPLHVQWRRSLLLFGLAVVGAVGFLAFVAPVIFPDTARGIQVRVNPQWYDPTKDPALQERVSTASGALNGIPAHPIIGNGAGSYGIEHMGEHGAPGWISNLELHILYDSGVLGLAAFATIVGLLLFASWRVFTRRGEPVDGIDLRPQLIGLLGSLAVLLVAFQATEGTWMAFFWVYVGLLARAASPKVGA
ncbi:MAG: O-antigen ligase family protein [Chloroflexota bacterium]